VLSQFGENCREIAFLCALDGHLLPSIAELRMAEEVFRRSFASWMEAELAGTRVTVDEDDRAVGEKTQRRHAGKKEGTVAAVFRGSGRLPHQKQRQ
jgi:hypothetical protein